jgi:hypothetical protein
VKFELYEYDTGERFGPASDEAVQRFKAALETGRPFFLYPYFGYTLRMVVREVSDDTTQVLVL